MLITINVPIIIKLTKKIPFNGLTSVTGVIISIHPSNVRILNNVIRDFGNVPQCSESIVLNR
jgi:hypothetical protein